MVVHILLSDKIRIGHATAWMRAKVCASFMVRPSLLPSDLHHRLRASCATALVGVLLRFDYVAPKRCELFGGWRHGVDCAGGLRKRASLIASAIRHSITERRRR